MLLYSIKTVVSHLNKNPQKCWKATLSGAAHLPSFFVRTSGHLDSLCVPTAGNLPIFFEKMLMPGGGGMGTAGID